MKKNPLNLAIVILSLTLLIFHTFTFARQYYNFTVTLLLFVSVVLLSILSNGIDSIRFGKRFALHLFSIVCITFVAYFMRGIAINTVLGYVLPFYIWPLLYSIVSKCLTAKSRKVFVGVFLTFYVIGAIATFAVLLKDVNASRLLAGAASEEQFLIYYSKGVGSYGFVFMSVFVFYSLLSWIGMNTKYKLSKFLLFLLVLFEIVLVLFASYTIAILMLICFFLLWLFFRRKNILQTIVVLGLVFAIFLLRVYLMNAMISLSNKFGLNYVANRFEQLVSLNEGRDVSDLKRYSLYSISFNSFLSNPLFGTGVVGGHSAVFDLLGNYGFFGLFLIVSIVINVLTFVRRFELKYKIAYFVIFIFSLIDTIDTIVFIPFVFFVMPLIFDIVSKRNEKKDESCCAS